MLHLINPDRTHSVSEDTKFPTDQEITASFCRLKISDPSKGVIEWLQSNFSQTKTRDDLISYLSREEIKLEDKFCHKEKPYIIFYFECYNRKSKRSLCKRISIKTVQSDAVKSEEIKQDCGFSCSNRITDFIFHRHKQERNKDGYEVIKDISEL